MTNALNTARYGRVDPGTGYGSVYNYTADQALSAAQSGGIVTNRGATADITVTLMPAVAGRRITLRRVAEYLIDVTPYSGDNIAGSVAAEQMFSRSTIRLVCDVTGTWEFDNSGSGGSSASASDYAVTDGEVLTAETLYFTLTNTGATGSVTGNLPHAVPGLVVFATKIEDQIFRLDVNGTDYVRGGAAGGYIEIREGTIVLECLIEDVWEVVGQSHTDGWRLEVDVVTEVGQFARYIRLEDFRSVYAEPGEYIVWPDFEDSLSLADSSNHLTQAQRQKNWRIFMEACLFANGGTGEYNGSGWYTWDSPNPAMNVSAGGTVFIPGPLMIEPYDDGEYAPNWEGDLGTQRFWTLPGALNIEGNVATQGDEATGGWNEINTKASRIICWNNYVGWYPRGGPPGAVASSYQHVSNWSIDNIGLMRKGTIAGPVFKTGHWTQNDTGPVVYVSQFWRIGRLIIDMQPASDAVENTGAEIRCGLTCQVEYLRVMGHQNAGWGIIYTGNYLNSGALQASSTSVVWDNIVVKGTGKGIGIAHAALHAGLVNMEQSASETSPKQRLVICEGGEDVTIEELWTENLRPVSSGHEAIIVVGQSTADAVSEGILPAGTTATSSTQSQVDIGWALLGAYSSTPIDYGIKILNGFVRVGMCRAVYLTTLFQLSPSVDDTGATIDYDSLTLATSNVTNVVSQTPFGSFTTYYGARDRRAVNYATPWVKLTADAAINTKAWGSRYWNKGMGANSAHRLPVATDADIGRFVTFMYYDTTYTFGVYCANGVVISNATQANPCRVTATGHGFTTGQRKWIHYVAGMTQLNGQYVYINVINADTVDLYTDSGLTVGVNSTGYGAYSSGGRLGGQKIGTGDVAATTNIATSLVPVTFEYVGEDRFAVIDGKEAL